VHLHPIPPMAGPAVCAAVFPCAREPPVRGGGGGRGGSVCMRVYTCVHVSVRVCVCACVLVCLCVPMRCTSVFVIVCLCVPIRVHMYMCMRLCVCVHRTCRAPVSVERAGYMCPPGSTHPGRTPCPRGTYSEGGAGACTPCPAGRYGASQAMASANCTAACTAGVDAAPPPIVCAHEVPYRWCGVCWCDRM
jgi:hypothetical protein